MHGGGHHSGQSWLAHPGRLCDITVLCCPKKEKDCSAEHFENADHVPTFSSAEVRVRDTRFESQVSDDTVPADGCPSVGHIVTGQRSLSTRQDTTMASMASTASATSYGLMQDTDNSWPRNTTHSWGAPRVSLGEHDVEHHGSVPAVHASSLNSYHSVMRNGSYARWSSLDHEGHQESSEVKAMHTACITGPDSASMCLDQAQVETFRRRVEQAGVDAKNMGRDGSKSLEDLFVEACLLRTSIFARGPSPGTLVRIVRLVKVKIRTKLDGVEHVLMSRKQFIHHGRPKQKVQPPIKKLSWTTNFDDALLMDAADFTDGDCETAESWRNGCVDLLEESLSLSQEWQNKHLKQDSKDYDFAVDRSVASAGYAGIITTYCVHQVTYDVLNPEHPEVGVIGLPDGQEFATAERFAGGRPTMAVPRGDAEVGDDGHPVGSRLNMWTWMRSSTAVASVRRSSAVSGSPGTARTSFVAGRRHNVVLKTHVKWSQQIRDEYANVWLGDGRIPPPVDAIVDEDALKCTDPPNGLLVASLRQQETNWIKVLSMATRILEPGYSLKDFSKDIGAFPELRLYLMEEKEDDEKKDPTQSEQLTTSGRSLGDEYQRTIGAFFAIYWMMRIHIDGKAGFTHGVNDHWAVEKSAGGDAKRQNFRSQARWVYFQKLLVDAGLLETRRGSPLSCKSRYVVNEMRFAALLALTAMHDIMKMSPLLPRVQKRHSPFRGYEEGDTIGDHDHALGYLLECHPDLLPSFRGLGAEQRRAVLFTQSTLSFNHGWFVQAEGPPGAMLTKCRETLVEGREGDRDTDVALKQDVALYFIHWLTDLAGAEPTPLKGCQKFVSKFPLPVLNSFLRSFEFIGQLVTNTETEVVEDYLRVRWVEQDPPQGKVPTGPGAIAKMRLVCMAQANSAAAVRAFDRTITDLDREVLSSEMSRTGCAGQSFSSDMIPEEVSTHSYGPAFLVYYGPAFLQQAAGADDIAVRLGILAEVYRVARVLWPLTVGGASATVTIRIDMLRAATVGDIAAVWEQGMRWVMVKHNETEAFVEKVTARRSPALEAQRYEVLDIPHSSRGSYAAAIPAIPE